MERCQHARRNIRTRINRKITILCIRSSTNNASNNIIIVQVVQGKNRYRFRTFSELCLLILLINNNCVAVYALNCTLVQYLSEQDSLTSQWDKCSYYWTFYGRLWKWRDRQYFSNTLYISKIWNWLFLDRSLHFIKTNGQRMLDTL